MSQAGTEVPIDPSARLLFEAVSELNWNIDAKTLAERVRRLQRGLSAEDEFMLLLSWLGKCQLVHKLEQFQVPPSSRNEIRIPDLLAWFTYNDHTLPVLVEVKVTKRKKLSWRPDFFESMVRYADLLKLPLLLAWKLADWGIWVLCDTSLFERSRVNYKLSFEKAIKNSLMGKLAGDFSYTLRPGVGVHFMLRKLGRGESKDPSEETWHLEVTDAYFTDGKGNHLNTLGPGIWWLFLGIDQKVETEESEDHFYHRFTITEQSPSQVAHRLVPLITAGLQVGEPVPWRQLLRNHSFKIGGQDLLKEAQSAIARNIIRNVIHQVPNELPMFLADKK